MKVGYANLRRLCANASANLENLVKIGLVHSEITWFQEGPLKIRISSRIYYSPPGKQAGPAKITVIEGDIKMLSSGKKICN